MSGCQRVFQFYFNLPILHKKYEQIWKTHQTIENDMFIVERKRKQNYWRLNQDTSKRECYIN